uniref:Hypocretin neuropeptide precursor n=1 Tax=Sinocyclocheilus rhinocerous TaxID=307959 RepID=A0A673J5P7_9TELE
DCNDMLVMKLHWNQKIIQAAAELIKSNRVRLLLFMALLAHLARDAEGVATCCSSASRSCKLYEILCRAGRRNDTSVARHIGRFNNDAAVGILTLGKRKVGERRVQDRLQQLLHGSRNQAAGILTMGKRFEDGGHLPLSYTMNHTQTRVKTCPSIIVTACLNNLTHFRR